MKKYKYIQAKYIEEYDDWEIVEIIAGGLNQNDMVILMKEENSEETIVNANTNETVNFEEIVEKFQELGEKMGEIYSKFAQGFIKGFKISEINK